MEEIRSNGFNVNEAVALNDTILADWICFYLSAKIIYYNYTLSYIHIRNVAMLWIFLLFSSSTHIFVPLTLDTRSFLIDNI